MAKLPVLSGAEVIRILERAGFSHERTHGSHAILVKRTPVKVSIPVPLHYELAKGTLLSIIKQSGLARKRFQK